MKCSVLVRPAAEADISAARDWYEARGSGLGTDFLNEVAAAMRGLEAQPKRGQLYYRSFRRILLRRFPYKVFYQIIQRRVVVFRVLHAKQDYEKRL